MNLTKQAKKKSITPKDNIYYELDAASAFKFMMRVIRGSLPTLYWVNLSCTRYFEANTCPKIKSSESTGVELSCINVVRPKNELIFSVPSD